jgi:hypothetical protein
MFEPPVESVLQVTSFAVARAALRAQSCFNGAKETAVFLAEHLAKSHGKNAPNLPNKFGSSAVRSIEYAFMMRSFVRVSAQCLLPTCVNLEGFQSSSNNVSLVSFVRDMRCACVRSFRQGMASPMIQTSSGDCSACMPAQHRTGACCNKVPRNR